MINAETNGNQFQALLPIQPGKNELSAVCQPGAVKSESVTVTGRIRNAPTAVIDIRLADGKIRLDGSGSLPAPANPSPIAGYRWAAQSPLNVEMDDQPTQVFAPPEEDGEYFISLEVTDQEGRSDQSRTYFVVSGGQPRLDDWTWQNTAWIEDAVVYGVIPRKFGPDGFRSIQERLPVLQEMGINALWLAPINVSPPGDYGYGVIDYFALRESHGTKEEFRAFIRGAHEHGIRVLMDFVPNHSSAQHPYFLDAEAKGKESHYWDYYDRDENGRPTHYFNWEHLPNLNYNNPEVENWMIEAFSYWVREFDVDGFRVDAAWGIRQRKPDFWPRWRAALKRIKPDLLLLAEASARDDYYFSEGFDAAYDWTDQLGKWAWERVFEDNTLLLYNLNTALTNSHKGYHEDALIFRFLNNNDTGARFISRYGLEMTCVATTMLLTLPGIPCIYTGDEIGAFFTPYGDPLPLSWDKDPHNLYAFHKKLVHLRHAVPALHSRGWQIIDAEPHQQVLAYLRFTDPGAPPVLVLLNFSNQPAGVEVDLPEPFNAQLRTASLTDLLSDEILSLEGSSTIYLQPMGARILSA